MSDKVKVFWSADERLLLARRAADLTVDHPELNGLALLRAAMEVLPPDRHRPLIALSQADWFRKMVQDEIQRRNLEDRLSSDAATAVREHIEKMQGWYAEQFARLDKIIPVIERMGAESRLTEQEEQLQRLHALKEIQERQVDVIGILEGTRDAHQESRFHYMELAATVVLLLKDLIGEVRTLNGRVVASPTVHHITPAAAAHAARRTRDPEHGDSAQSA